MLYAWDPNQGNEVRKELKILLGKKRQWYPGMDSYSKCANQRKHNTVAVEYTRL